jgi:hypothetical protein
MRVLSIKVSKKKSAEEVNFGSESGQIRTVGGHAENFAEKDGFLVKKTNQTEGRFYQNLARYGLSDFVPRCKSVELITEHNEKMAAQEFSKITLEDLRKGYVEPVIYDIKLGKKTFSSKEFKLAQNSNSEILRKDIQMHLIDAMTSTKKRGYRFVGSSTSTESRRHLAVHPDEMIQDMARMIKDDDLLFVIKELEKLLIYLMTKEGRRFEMIGASILIVAEADGEACLPPKVKVIDFAHSNIIVSNGILLTNGAFSTPHRKAVYQRGFRNGLVCLIDDLKDQLDKVALYKTI